ncbi:GNAT family N-acetyltransferase [Massilia sp. MB5]|nr:MULTISPECIES: GNAT family N-acetyltransferase [unclassified Massilia]AKU25165.1 acetyltransferase [Massilia sp. NR 4-1]UMR33452.1 GNAT family N-acetyltransferase [Massilia sp. MB5]
MYKLLAPAVQVGEEDPSSDEARLLLEELSVALAGITGDSGAASFSVDDVRGAGGRFVVARDAQGRALGCGAIRPLQDGVAELKRMYARPGTRGVGSAVLAHLEQAAADLGYRALWLETRLVNSRAVGFYAARGYLRIPNFGKYVGNSAAVCMAKRLIKSE